MKKKVSESIPPAQKNEGKKVFFVNPGGAVLNFYDKF